MVEALGKKTGPEDDDTEGKRFHDALQRLARTSSPLPTPPAAGNNQAISWSARCSR